MLRFFTEKSNCIFCKKSSFFSAEWTYLLVTRKVGGEDSAFSYVRIKYGSNATDTVTGVIIYPDDFSFSEAGVASMPFGARKNYTQINAADWAALEEAGCVFLPSCRNSTMSSGQLVIGEAEYGSLSFYWSSSASSASNAFSVFFSIGSGELRPNNAYGRDRGFPVRLVQDL